MERKYAGIFGRAHNLFQEANSFPRKSSSRETLSFEKQIMPKDKYPSIFSRQMDASVLIVLVIFVEAHIVLKTREYFTVRPVIRKSYGSIAHEAKPNGLFTPGP